MKNRVEINNNWRELYSTNSKIKFKIIMLISSFCDYSHVYILVNGNIRITGNAGPPAERTQAQIQTPRQNDGRNKDEKFKNCAPFTDCISEIKNTQICQCIFE